ncbi:MAG: chromate transporter [Gemmatimonas sp.]
MAHTDPGTEAVSDRTPASLGAIFSLFFQIGAMSFGGGLMAWAYREVVEKRHWLTPTEAMSGIALAQVLPGVNITNFAVYVGERMRGFVGATAAVTGLLTVPFFAIIALAAVYDRIASVPWAHHFMDGVAVTAVGLVLSVTVKSARATVRGLAPVAVMTAMLVTVGVLRWPLVPAVAAIAPLSIAIAWWTPRRGPDAR